MIKYELFVNLVDYLFNKYPEFLFSFENNIEIDKINVYIVYPKHRSFYIKQRHKKLSFDTWFFEDNLEDNVKLIEYEAEHFFDEEKNQYANDLLKAKDKDSHSTRANCVNCGAIVEKGKEKCSYCGTYY